MDNRRIEYAKLFKALGDENRLQIIELLQSGEKCACVLLDQLNVSQSTLSHHMKLLVQSGVVAARNEGKWTYYSISFIGIQLIKDMVDRLSQGCCRNMDVCCGK